MIHRNWLDNPLVRAMKWNQEKHVNLFAGFTPAEKREAQRLITEGKMA